MHLRRWYLVNYLPDVVMPGGSCTAAPAEEPHSTSTDDTSASGSRDIAARCLEPGDETNDTPKTS